jgi:4'-phosphopantetheinyl transferase
MDGVTLAWRSPDADGDAVAAALTLLSDAELERYEATAPTRRAHFLTGRALLRELAGEQLRMAPVDVPLVAVCPDCGGPHGRPVITGSRLHLGLTHTPEMVVAVAGWDRAIGIDAEPRHRDQDRDAAISAVTGGRGIQHWTRVEATLKADGRGLRLDPRDVRVTGDRARISGSSAVYELFEPHVDASIHVSVARAI